MDKIIIAITLKDAAWLSYVRDEELVNLRSLFIGSTEQMLDRLAKIEQKDGIVLGSYSIDLIRTFQETGIKNCFWLGRFSAETWVRWNGVYESSRHLIRESPAIQFKSLVSELSLTFSAQTMSSAIACKLLMAKQEFSPSFTGTVSREN